MSEVCHVPHCRAFSPLTVEDYSEDASLLLLLLLMSSARASERLDK